MGALLEIIEDRYVELLERVKRGEDVPPGRALRLEGMLETAVLLELCDQTAIDQRLDALHRQVLGRPAAQLLGEDWREALPFPALPLFMDRAPVYPSTSD